MPNCFLTNMVVLTQSFCAMWLYCILQYIILLCYCCYSPDMPENEATFSITAGGINDAKD